MRTLAALALLSLAGSVLAGPEEAAVQVLRTGPRDGSGSGTVVQSGKTGSLVLTNWHVAPDPTSRFTVRHGERAYPARWVAADDRTDLALLRVDVPLPAVDLAEDVPAVGTELRQWGCSEGGPPKAKAGPLMAETARAVVWTPFGRATTADTCRVNITPQFGDSGAALVDPTGRVVAVIYCGDVATQSRPDGTPVKALVAPETCVALADIKRFLARHPSD